MALAIDKLRLKGSAGKQALEALLNHSSPYVRSWSAAELLSQGNEVAKPVLEQLMCVGGTLGMAAQYVLKEHEQGRLLSPFEARRA